MAVPLLFTNDKENSASCTPAPPSSWWLETVISSEVQIHITVSTCIHMERHTATPLHKIKAPAESCTVGPSAQCSTHSLIQLQVRGHKTVPSYRNIQWDLPHPLLPILPVFSSFIHPPLFTPFCSAVISHFVSSKWLLTVLTELSFFVCQSQAYVLCIFTTLLWPLLYRTEMTTYTSVTLTNSHVFIFF